MAPVALTAVAWTLVANQLPVELGVALAWLAILIAAFGLGWHQGRATKDAGNYRQVWREASTRARKSLVVSTVVVVALTTVLQVVSGTGVLLATGLSVISAVVILALMWPPDLPDDYRQAIRTRAIRLRRGVAIGLIATAGITWLLPAPDPIGHGIAAFLAFVSLAVGAAAGWIWSRTHAWRLDLRGGCPSIRACTDQA